MKTRLLLAVASALLLITAPRAGAQVLDGTWFKVVAAVKGAAVDPSGETGKAKGKITVYMQVDAAVQADGLSGVLYDFVLWSETAPGNWQVTDMGQFSTAGDGERVMAGPQNDPDNSGVSLGIAVPDEDSTTLDVSFLASLKIKLDGTGALKKARFKSAGGIVPAGDSGGTALFGGAKVNGKTVTPEQLPFTPGA